MHADSNKFNFSYKDRPFEHDRENNKRIMEQRHAFKDFIEDYLTKVSSFSLLSLYNPIFAMYFNSIILFWPIVLLLGTSNRSRCSPTAPDLKAGRGIGYWIESNDREAENRIGLSYILRFFGKSDQLKQPLQWSC